MAAGRIDPAEGLRIAVAGVERRTAAVGVGLHIAAVGVQDSRNIAAAVADSLGSAAGIGVANNNRVVELGELAVAGILVGDVDQVEVFRMEGIGQVGEHHKVDKALEVEDTTS